MTTEQLNSNIDAPANVKAGLIFVGQFVVAAALIAAFLYFAV